MSQVRMLLVDDNDDFLDVISDWLAGRPGVRIVGRAHTGKEAIDQIDRLGPDLVLMDVSMPELNGFEAARRIKSRPGAPVVVLATFHDSQAARHEAWVAGADEFIAKENLTERLAALLFDLQSGQPDQARQRFERRRLTEARRRPRVKQEESD